MAMAADAAAADAADVVVAGGGVIGSAIAWRAAAAGLGTVVVDPEAGDAASLVAAGMLAPVSESVFGEDTLLRLNLLAVSRFPGFAAELEEAAGRSVGLRREGTLAVAYDPDDRAALQRLTDFRRSVGLDAHELDSRACRQLEPFLAPGVRGGVLFAGDWSVDSRRYAAALRAAALAAGVAFIKGRVTAVRTGADGAVAGVRLAAGGAGSATVHASGTGEIDSGAVVVAAGCWSAGIEGLPDAVRAAVRPVKGQLLRLRHPAGMPPVTRRTIRALVGGADVYLVPRADGELVVGATQEERGHDVTVTAGAVHDLLRDAMSVLPVTSELALAETSAGLRPGTPDNGPIVGPAGPPGLLVATGHYRNGILLSAATADAVTACLSGGRPAPEWEPFAPQRFRALAGIA
jgi:glycine oxidase